ncbi:uncharacterized protein LAESUDRAFT_723872 [Laetiporus sulphureus 93-53]|uniref:Uncharacterized protein n=1 Tax=Laetiporus sulphureus 93-53 TaxID=1314785 RepID=A0A165F4F7_9APHY|nr:uncharacterized protein LAESUDRAFT_723872 [Laetiporus sulphureus 93-53]KZT08365.1 hypothetical protein LAESUDRAFT_723872 [Laetiporus sulphureus 93-53]
MDYTSQWAVLREFMLFATYGGSEFKGMGFGPGSGAEGTFAGTRFLGVMAKSKGE